MNPFAPNAKIRLKNATGDYQNFDLFFSPPAIARLEEEAGKSLFETFGKISSGKVWITDIRDLIWCGLLHLGEKAPSREQLIDRMDLKDLPAYAASLNEAISRSFPSATPNESPRPTPEALPQ
jgi:hypothetical protein